MSAIDALLPDTDVLEADLPRSQSGGRSQYLTVTLLADYGMRQHVSWPSAGVVSLLGEFGVSSTAARAALSRLSRRGVLRVSRSGRRTSYQLTPEAAAVLAFGGQRVARFAGDAETWDDRWTLVAFAHAGEGSEPRRLRSRLRWLGFAPLYDALWIAPRADPLPTVAALDNSAPAALTVFRAREVELSQSTRRPLAAWDLSMVAAQYDAFLREWEWVLDIGTEPVDGARALVARTRMIDEYRRFPALDPQLPGRLMPDDWPRQRARDVFEHGYDHLGQVAETRVREVLDAAGIAVPEGLAHHTVADLAAANFWITRPHG